MRNILTVHCALHSLAPSRLCTHKMQTSTTFTMSRKKVVLIPLIAPQVIVVVGVCAIVSRIFAIVRQPSVIAQIVSGKFVYWGVIVGVSSVVNHQIRHLCLWISLAFTRTSLRINVCRAPFNDSICAIQGQAISDAAPDNLCVFLSKHIIQASFWGPRFWGGCLTSHTNCLTSRPWPFSTLSPTLVSSGL